MIAGRSRPRPSPTTIETSCTVVGVALPPSRSSTIAWRRAAGTMLVGERVAQLVAASRSERAKRNSSSSTSSSVPSARATSNRPRA